MRPGVLRMRRAMGEKGQVGRRAINLRVAAAEVGHPLLDRLLAVIVALGPRIAHRRPLALAHAVRAERCEDRLCLVISAQERRARARKHNLRKSLTVNYPWGTSLDELEGV